MKLDAFDYTLPSEMIATSPAKPRETARLLDLSGSNLIDRQVGDLPSLLRSGDVLVVNNTEVIPARLKGKRGEASISVTLHKRVSDHVWRAFAKPAKKCRINDIIVFSADFAATVRGRGVDGDVELGFIDPAGGDSLTGLSLMSVFTNTAACHYHLTSCDLTGKETVIKRTTKRCLQSIRVRWQRRPRGCILLQVLLKGF